MVQSTNCLPKDSSCFTFETEEYSLAVTGDIYTIKR